MRKSSLLIAVLLCCCLHKLTAKKRKMISREIVTCQSACFRFVHNNIRTVGNIYELEITVNADGVTIDSAWFGATPVPCDVYETRTLQRLAAPVSRGKYLVKANRDLYQHFFRNIDSTFAYEHFSAPFPFKGEMILLYSYKGKRYYKTIYSIVEKPQKPLRDHGH